MNTREFGAGNETRANATHCAKRVWLGCWTKRDRQAVAEKYIHTGFQFNFVEPRTVTSRGGGGEALRGATDLRVLRRDGSGEGGVS